MCGIVGYTGTRAAAPILIGALKDLEYRGYDSAGIALLTHSANSAGIAITKREGRIANLEAAVDHAEVDGAMAGIGHTRWATHGKPSDANAHPHDGCGRGVVVIHNGIVENYAPLRQELLARGHEFRSDTDSETIVHLMEERLEAGDDLLSALRAAAGRLEGSQAIVAMSSADPAALVAARLGNAGGVVVGYGEGEMFVASDLAAVLPHTSEVAFLGDGQFARIAAAGPRYVTAGGESIEVARRQLTADSAGATRGGYSTFMLKEIMEQPEALSDTIRSLVTAEPPEVHLPDAADVEERLASINRVILIGMGTSLHAAMIGRNYIERIAGIPAEWDNASEFRYRDAVIDERTLVVSVSQSGETVDVLEAMHRAQLAGAVQITICNTEGAQTARVADGAIYTRAGLERGVASTKCFTTAVCALYALALKLGEAHGRLGAAELGSHITDLLRVPEAVGRVLASNAVTPEMAAPLATRDDMLFLGRGLELPIAMEGALKMKEISYIHAEGYAAGEMKHGPIALIDEGFPVVAIATEHALRSKMVSNIQQVEARGGEVVAIVTDGDSETATMAGAAIAVPSIGADFEPIVATIPLQLLAYHVAVSRGCDVDQPRNLAKTVTVE
ncbi:MAG TPA: glutamine--fructose-6-phosphate transaminase (isomerizing) [Tepidiformaceae bacterium]|nr:glutamine--fructose-6-phosphate transaminase (isomerizing) [Tepidiformaceae bacterium]